MIYTAMTKKAMKLAYEAHQGQTDKTACRIFSIRSIWQSR